MGSAVTPPWRRPSDNAAEQLERGNKRTATLDMDVRTQIAGLLVRRCSNCYHELPGYNVRAAGWNWFTPNLGPFCNDCFNEVESFQVAQMDEPNG